MVKNESTISPELQQSSLHNSHTSPQHDFYKFTTDSTKRWRRQMLRNVKTTIQKASEKSTSQTGKRIHRMIRVHEGEKINAGWERGSLRRSLGQWMIQSDWSMIRGRAGEA